MLAVIQPYTPGQAPLAATRDELRCIQKHVHPSFLRIYGLQNQPAQVQDIISQLPTASIAHFACHGVQNLHDPLDSALVLNERLSVAQLMRLKVPHSSLVYLSACQTAMGDDELRDELMHLAAVFLFAGYSSAVATLWYGFWPSLRYLIVN